MSTDIQYHLITTKTNCNCNCSEDFGINVVYKYEIVAHVFDIYNNLNVLRSGMISKKDKNMILIHEEYFKKYISNKIIDYENNIIKQLSMITPLPKVISNIIYGYVSDSDSANLEISRKEYDDFLFNL